MGTLEEPLLDDDTYNRMNQKENEGWSQEHADRAVVYAPAEWELEPDTTCRLKYDGTRNLLVVVSSDSDEVLEAMDVRDVIGAELQLSFFGNQEDRRVGFRNTKARPSSPSHGEETDIDVSGCDVLGALQSDADRVFSNDKLCVSNEEDFCGTAFLHIYVYPRRDPSQEGWLSWCGVTNHKQTRTPNVSTDQDPASRSNRYAHHRKFEVVPCLDFYDIGQVVKGIRRVAKLGQFSDPNSSKVFKYLVVVNPTSGLKKGAESYETIIKPMLDQACVKHDVIMTTHHNHANEIMAQDDRVKECDGIIAVGGDGILNEVLNGIQRRNNAKELLERIGIGVVACGTSNGLAKSLLHACQEKYGILESVFLICKGQTQKLDLSTYHVQDKQYTSFLTFSYGYIADIDIESECIRSCGILRNDIWGAWRIISLRTYRARFSYLPPSSSNKIFSMPALTDPVPKDWVTVEDDFVVFWAAHVSHAASNAHNSPMSKLNDGVFQVFVVRAPISRLKMATIALGIEGATHVNCPDSEFYECVAYRLEPLSEGSFNDLDGEVIESGPVQAHVAPSAMNVYCGTPGTSSD